MTPALAAAVAMATGALIGGAGVWLLMARHAVRAEQRRTYASHVRAVTSVPDADRALAYDLIRRGQR